MRDFQIGQRYGEFLKSSATKQPNNIYSEQYQNKIVSQLNNQNNELSKEREDQVHSLYSSMQVTVQPLIRPLQPTSRNQPVQVVAPIVYSFRQPNYANRMSGGYVNNKSVQTTNSGTEQKALNIDDDNFADILGYAQLL